MKKIQETCESHKKEMLIVKDTNHFHQCDAIAVVPLESALRSLDKFQLNYLELYLLHSQLILHFMSRLGFANSYDLNLIEDNIRKLIDKYVVYINKFTPDIEVGDKDIQNDGENDSLLAGKKE